MRSPAFAFAFVIAVAFSGYAFADPQPLTRADCEKAGMKWDDSANVCGSSQDAAAPDASAPDASAAPDAGDAAAAAAAASAPEKRKEFRKGEKKIVKTVKTSKGTKKIVIHKKPNKHGHHQSAKKKEQRGFFKWLKEQEKKS